MARYAREHIDYPHEPGYLLGCNGCEFGPCQCAGTDNAECVSSDHWEPDPNSPAVFECGDCGEDNLTMGEMEFHGGGQC